MPAIVPVYQQQVGEAALPTFRRNVRDVAAEAQGQAARQLGEVGRAIQQGGQGVAEGVAQVGDVVKQVQDEHETAALQDAYAQLSRTKQHLLEDPTDGFVARKGKDAMAQSKDFSKRFQDAAEQIRDTLPEGKVRQRFQGNLDQESVSFQDSLDVHVNRQSDIVAEQALTSALGAAQSDALSAAGRGEDDQVHKAMGIGEGALLMRAKAMGWTHDFTVQQLKAWDTQVHLGVLDQMMDGGRLTAASQYLETHREAMDQTLLAKSNIEKSLRLANDAAVGAGLARKALVGATTDVVRPWDPTPIAHLDPAKATAQLQAIEADPGVPETVKQAAREHTEALVRGGEQQWKGVLDDVYSRAVTKLANNGWRLSSLGQEKAFLLDPEVDGGRIWDAILGARDQQLRSRSSEPPTPAQREAMVRYLITLPDRQNEYMTGDPKAFLREWQPQLSPSDLEQAAGYVARAGQAAARPPPELPGPIVAQIKTYGREAGGWGPKGPDPKNDNQQRAYLTLYQDLLQKATDLKREGKTLDEDAIKQTAADWAQKMRIEGTGIFGTSVYEDEVTRLQAETNPKYAGKKANPVEQAPAQPAAPQFPDAFRQSAFGKLRAQGIEPTPEMLLYLWRQANGVPAAQNPMPPTQAFTREIELP